MKNNWQAALDLIVRDCLAEAYGEPGYAVALIYDRVGGDLQRRRAVNCLWYILKADRSHRFERGAIP
jgi:hypothetical protein